MRQRLRAVGVLALAVVAITCTDAPTSPNKTKPAASGSARITMSPSFSPEAARIYSSLAAFGFEVTEVHIVLTGPDGSKKDTVIAFPAIQDQITIEIPVPSSGTDQPFDALVELRNDKHVVLFSGHQTVIARGANLPPQTPPLVIISYTGPGKGTKTVTFSAGHHDRGHGNGGHQGVGRGFGGTSRAQPAGEVRGERRHVGNRHLGGVSWTGGTLSASANAIFASDHALYNSAQIVQGNAVFGGVGAGRQQFAGGTLTLLGNFSQNLGTVTGQTGQTFVTSSDHTTNFFGSTAQTIAFATPTTSSFSVLHTQNSSAGGVQFTTNAQIVNGTTQPRVDILSGKLQVNSGSTFTVSSGQLHLGPSTNLNLLGNILNVGLCTGRMTNGATITGSGLFNGSAYTASTCTP